MNQTLSPIIATLAFVTLLASVTASGQSLAITDLETRVVAKAEGLNQVAR